MGSPLPWFNQDTDHVIHNDPTLPGMRESPEMRAGFQRYWYHYGLMQEWMATHINAHHMQSEQFKKPLSANVRRRKMNVQNAMGQFEQRTRRRRTKTNEGLHEKEESMEDQCSVSSLPTSEVSDCSVEKAQSTEFVVEVSEELRDFFIKSQKHREEREKKRLEEMERDTGDAEDEGSGVSKKNSTEAPKERPGLKRNQEMKVLYGKYTPMIQGLETAIQMEFDHILDQKQPELWPSIALNL